MHPTPAWRLIAIPLFVLSLWALPSSAAAAGPGNTTDDARADRTERSGSTGTGYDISYPQCGGPFPRDPAFGIVGVNGGIVFSPNPCLGAGNGPSELAWAGIGAQLYVNTGNPGPELSSHWPLGQTMPRACRVDDPDSIECAYDYGWNAAEDSYRTAVEAYVSLGWAARDATRTPMSNRWWLDVETTNSWREHKERNIAALQGAVAYLKSVDAGEIGFYSTGYQWGQITGGTQAFSEHAAWVAGATTLRGAKANCAGAGFTGGRIEMTQYFAKGFDADYRC